MLWSCTCTRSLAAVLCGKHFTVITDHQTLTHLYYMQVSSQRLEDVDIVQNDSELFASAVSLFPLLDPEKLLEEQRSEFGP